MRTDEKIGRTGVLDKVQDRAALGGRRHRARDGDGGVGDAAIGRHGADRCLRCLGRVVDRLQYFLKRGPARFEFADVCRQLLSESAELGRIEFGDGVQRRAWQVGNAAQGTEGFDERLGIRLGHARDLQQFSLGETGQTVDK